MAFETARSQVHVDSRKTGISGGPDHYVCFFGTHAEHDAINVEEV